MDVKSLFICRSVSKTFKHVIDREINLWNEMYANQRKALLRKFDELGNKVKLNGNTLDKIVSKKEWSDFIPEVDVINDMEQTRKLIKKYHYINNVEIPDLELDSDLNFNAELRSRKDIVEYLSLILHVIPLPGFSRLAPYFPGKHFRTSPGLPIAPAQIPPPPPQMPPPVI